MTEFNPAFNEDPTVTLTALQIAENFRQGRFEVDAEGWATFDELTKKLSSPGEINAGILPALTKLLSEGKILKDSRGLRYKWNTAPPPTPALETKPSGDPHQN